MAKEKIRITSELSALLPGESFKIGNSVIIIKPLTITELASVLQRIAAVKEDLKEKNILSNDTVEVSPESETEESVISYDIISSVIICLIAAPSILSDMSGIHEDDIKELPPTIAAELASKCIEVNLKAKDELIKNFNSLAMVLQSLAI